MGGGWLRLGEGYGWRYPQTFVPLAETMREDITAVIITIGRPLQLFYTDVISKRISAHQHPELLQQMANLDVERRGLMIMAAKAQARFKKT